MRVDAGVADGSMVGVHYDAMLAKVIAQARPATRPAAAGPRAGRGPVHGVVTNRDLLVGILREAGVRAAVTSTPAS